MSLENAHYVFLILGLGAIILQILSVVALGVVIFRPKENKYLSLIKNNFLAIGLFISLSAVLSSFFFSEVMSWAPCVRCWWDRVLIFPQAVIYGVALWKREKNNVFWYAFILTLLGLINSLYHLYIYYFGEGLAPCDASGVSCVQRLVSEYGGYISIPSLAFTGFFALMVLLIVEHCYQNN